MKIKIIELIIITIQIKKELLIITIKSTIITTIKISIMTSCGSMPLLRDHVV